MIVQTYSNLIEVNPRFTRSVSITRDFANPDALQGYLLTPVGEAVLGRIAAALREEPETGTKAWSLTGPYGSGKSAFGLLVAQALCATNKAKQISRNVIEKDQPLIHEKLFGPGAVLKKKSAKLIPILITGSRQPLEKVLAAKLAEELRALSPRGRPPQVVEELEAVANNPKPTGTKVAELFEEANNTYLSRFDTEAEGLLLVIDELGKFLEFGASHPDQGDVFLLQELAEIASRSKRPFLVITILHQSMERYTDQMAPSKRAEWAKVQGRFEDIAFEDRIEQIIRLTAKAIEHRKHGENSRIWQKQAAQQLNGIEKLDVSLPGIQIETLNGLLEGCFPLHPIVTLIAGPLFRLFAQNERSLFAFLSSSERHGFHEFLTTTEFNPRNAVTYRVDQLFDYAAHAIGQTQAGGYSRVWHEIQAALERLTDASTFEMYLAKTIGLLQLLGSKSPVPASIHTLRFALKDLGDSEEVDRALEKIKKNSLVVYRKHLNSYALWEGSDIDVGEKLEEAKRYVRQDQPLAEFLTQLMPPKPIVAKKHYFQKGTLRYFAVRYADALNLEKVLEKLPDDADGLVIFCLPANFDEKKKIILALESAEKLNTYPILAAIPSGLADLRALCNEVLGWRWVISNTPDLNSDRIARKEIQSRLEYCEKTIRHQLAYAFKTNGSEQIGCDWFFMGSKKKFKQAKELNNFLSNICEERYCHTPTWRNELINRQALSSSAAAARRDLIKAMIDSPEKENLGLEGHPPERTIYETLLLQSRLHRKKGSEWGFYPPDAKSDPAIHAVWKAIEEFLTDTENGRLPVMRLFQRLKHPPYGLKEGPLPILLTAALIYFDSDVALYEDGTFQPQISEAIFERFFHAPEKFEVQQFKIAGPRKKVFSRYTVLLQTKQQKENNEEVDLLSLVKPLVRFAKTLPDYVHKTKTLSETAQKVNRVLREARQPDQLLFVEMPEACGYVPFTSSGKVEVGELDAFIDKLRNALSEIRQAYPKLVQSLKGAILNGLELPTNFETGLKELCQIAEPIIGMTVDLQLKGFLVRATDGTVDPQTWTEALATLLASRPPVAWEDIDRAKFDANLVNLSRTFKHQRMLALEAGKSGYQTGTTYLRLSIGQNQAKDAEKIVAITPNMQENVRQMQREISEWMEKQGIDKHSKVSLAALSQIVKELIIAQT